MSFYGNIIIKNNNYYSEIVFDDLKTAQNYAETEEAYVGQQLTVITNDNADVYIVIERGKIQKLSVDTVYNADNYTLTLS